MRVSGVELVRNAENLGFLRTCNRAVGAARGEYILLLNNDTVVHAGAVDAMLETFAQFDNVGAVCAQLRFADGTLQEAGGIVWPYDATRFLQRAIGKTKLGANGTHIVKLREGFKHGIDSSSMNNGVVIEKQNIFAPRSANSAIAGA